MPKKNTGLKFEKLAESIFNKLVKNPVYEKVEHNVKLTGADGDRQIDVLVSSESVGIKFKTIIECRDFKGKLSVSAIDGFHSKLLDVKANKGILISRKGFSSRAISKAKRLGISLCTADETEKEGWQSIIDLPVLIEELSLQEFSIQAKHNSTFNGKVSKESILQINGFDIVKLINEKWRKAEFKIGSISGYQKLEFPEIQEPLLSKTTDGVEFNFIYLEVKGKVRARFYRTSISKLSGTQILENITEGKKNIFIDINALKEIDPNLFQMTKTNLDNDRDFVCEIRILPNVSFTIDDVKVIE